jgi:hypothetical protein
MLRLRAPNPAEVLTLAYFKHSWKCIRKTRFGVTAMLSYQQVQNPGRQSVGQAAHFCLGPVFLSESCDHMVALCLSKIKSGHIRGAIRRGLGGKEYALPSSRCAIGARPYPRPSACASHYSSERKISESGAYAPRNCLACRFDRERGGNAMRRQRIRPACRCTDECTGRRRHFGRLLHDLPPFTDPLVGPSSPRDLPPMLPAIGPFA